MRCRICKEDITGGRPIWRNSHYQTVHSEYTTWLRRWLAKFIVGIIFFPCAVGRVRASLVAKWRSVRVHDWDNYSSVYRLRSV